MRRSVLAWGVVVAVKSLLTYPAAPAAHAGPGDNRGQQQTQGTHTLTLRTLLRGMCTQHEHGSCWLCVPLSCPTAGFRTLQSRLNIAHTVCCCWKRCCATAPAELCVHQPIHHTWSKSSLLMSPYFHLNSRLCRARPLTSAEGWPVVLCVQEESVVRGDIGVGLSGPMPTQSAATAVRPDAHPVSLLCNPFGLSTQGLRDHHQAAQQ